MAINCAAVPENLLESELFGHEKGAFTGALDRKPGLFEVADRGVLFLDEIGEVSAAVQAKLLRAIETKEFFRVGGTRPVRADVRVVSATNKDLKREMQEGGGFREDLYYRLNGVTLQLPPLRERPADIPLLARHFLERSGARKKPQPRAPSRRCSRYSWPGNVRELQMVIQRAACAQRDGRHRGRRPAAGRAATRLEGRAARAPASPWPRWSASTSRPCSGRTTAIAAETARALGIDPKTLYNKLGPARPRAVREG